MAGPRHVIYAVEAERTDGVIDEDPWPCPRAVIVADSDEEAVSLLPELPEGQFTWTIMRIRKADKGVEKGIYAREYFHSAFLDTRN